MYQRKSRRAGAAMVALSLCLRLCILLGLDAKAAALLSQAAQTPVFAQWMLYLETGQVASVEQPEDTQVFVLQWERPENDAEAEDSAPQEMPKAPEDVLSQETPASVPTETFQSAELPAVLASADAIPIAGGCTYTVDKAALLAQPSTLDFSVDGPTILILHTHASEAYTPEPGWEYEESGAYRTLDLSRSVVAVGKALAETLRRYGLEVIHDATVNDYPSYNDSYANALSRIEAWKAQYPSLQMVIDVHRDAVAGTDGQAYPLSATVNGAEVAQLMLVVGTDQGGLYHPNWQENLANALKLQSVLEGAYPGLCRNLNLRTERFNQHATPGSILVEFGSNGNTLSQAIQSAELLGQSIASMIEAISQNGGVLS